MNRKTIKANIEVATNLAVLFLAVILLSIGAVVWLVKPAGPKLSAGLQKGKAFGQGLNVDYSLSDHTLLIALNASCSHCQASIPLFRKVMTAHNQNYGSTQLVALFPDAEKEVAQYLQQNQLSVRSVADLQLDSFQISSTPTMVLVDSRGLITDFRSGMLSDQEIADFLHVLDQSNRRSP